MEMAEGVAEPKRGSIIQSTSKRVRMIFSVMASPNRIDILRILNSKGPLTYSELKSLAGFKSKKESGKFAYHLRKLLRQSLVALNKSERRYTITNLGKLVLSLARQIEERSIIESGKMYVRTSGESIEEFNSNKVIQSLVREGSLPLELAQKITEEVENRIYKHQTSYLTGPLIREMVNAVLLEHGHEDYRAKMARLGMPAYDVQQAMSDIGSIDNGAEGLLFRSGQAVFGEYLLANTMPKDVADSHLGGDLHISDPGVWSLLPDTIFVNARELVEEGTDLGGKHLGVSRIPSTKTADDMATALSIAISLISKEASQEVVIDGMPQLIAKHAKSADLEPRLANALAAASTSAKYGGQPVAVSIRLQLGSEAKAVSSIINAYLQYVRMTPIPRIGLIVDAEKGKLADVSARLAEAVMLGGRVAFGRGPVSGAGVAGSATSSSIKLQSVSVNLPRLAFESNKDETYFRARLALLITPVLASMSARKKDVSDLTRRGLNPVLAKNSQYMQRGSATLIVNLVGLREAIFGILGYKDDKAGRAVLYKVIETAVDVAAKKGRETGDEIKICMTRSPAADRFVSLDGEKYGKNSALSGIESYDQGFELAAEEIGSMDAKSDQIAQCARLSKALNGGLSVRLAFGDGASQDDIKAAIEKAASLLPSFVPAKAVPICGGCGYKDPKLADKCPSCKSPHILL